MNIPPGWQIELPQPINYSFNGICSGGTLTLLGPDGYREQFVLAPPLAQLTGIPEQLLDMQIIVVPADSLRITQSVPGVNWRLQYSVSLTPNGDHGPWRIDYYTKVSNPAAATPNSSTSAQTGSPDALTQHPASANHIPELPPRSTAAPDVSPMLEFGG